MTDLKQAINDALHDNAKNTINVIMEYARIYSKNNVTYIVEELSKLNYNLIIDGEIIIVNFGQLKFKISDISKERVKLEAYNNSIQIDFGSTTHNCHECINTIHRIVMLYASVSEILNSRDVYVYHTSDPDGNAHTHSNSLVNTNNFGISIDNKGKLTISCNIKRYATAQDPNITQSLNNILEFFESIA